MSERRNVPEIAIGFRELLRRPKLGSISSLRCQKSRTRVRWDATCEVMFSRTISLVRQSARLRSSSYAGHASIAMPAAPRIAKGEAWWSQTGSNRRPHACKARALPAELCPQTMVGLGRLERPTSPLSGVRSNHLSYRPESLHPRTRARSAAAPRQESREPFERGLVREERET
jgi:hypothetical protein